MFTINIIIHLKAPLKELLNNFKEIIQCKIKKKNIENLNIILFCNTFRNNVHLIPANVVELKNIQ